MGIGVIVHGFIECPGTPYHRIDIRRISRANRRVIASLPASDDDWPFITRGMFGMQSLRTSFDRCIAQYENQVIHFAGDYKNMYVLEADWLTKFETLLARLYWSSVVVMVEFTGLRYEWHVAREHVRERYSQDPPQPPTAWSFECFNIAKQPIPPHQAIDGVFSSPYHCPGENRDL